jgi:hypothetical protein
LTRATRFFNTNVDSRPGPDGFAITSRLMDSATKRRVQYEGQFAGDERSTLVALASPRYAVLPE